MLVQSQYNGYNKHITTSVQVTSSKYMCTAHLDATNMCNATCSPTACIAHCKFGAEGILRLFLQPSSGHWDARDGCLLHCTSLSAESIRGWWEGLHWLRMWCVSCLVWGHMTSNKCPRHTTSYWIQKHMWFWSEIRLVQNGWCMHTRTANSCV